MELIERIEPISLQMGGLWFGVNGSDPVIYGSVLEWFLYVSMDACLIVCMSCVQVRFFGCLFASLSV